MGGDLTEVPDSDCSAKHLSLSCPLCRLPLELTGRITAGCDEAGQHFSFAICWNCAQRLERLPIRVQFKQLRIAVNRLADDPVRFKVNFHESEWAAKLFVALESETMSIQNVVPVR